jgi:minor tail protein
MSDEAINVRIGAAIGELLAGLTEANAAIKENVTSMKETFESLQATVDAAMGPLLAIGALLEGGELFKESIEKVSELGAQLEIMSEKTGVSVETLSRLEYAADLSHVSVEQLTVGVERMARSMEESEKGTGTANDAFHALGITVTDATGHLRPLEDVLLQVAQKFSTMQDGAGKTALAMDLFGRSGAEMIPFLNEGAEGIARLQQQADQLGVTMSGKDAEAAVAYEDAMKSFHAVMSAMERTMVLELMPALTDAARAFTDAGSKTDAFRSVMSLVSGAVRLVSGSILEVIGSIRALNTIMSVDVTNLTAFKAAWKEAGDIMKQTGIEVRRAFGTPLPTDPKAPPLSPESSGGGTAAPKVTTITPLTTMDKYREELNEKKELAIKAGEDVDAIELQFWQEKLAITDKNSKDYIDIQTRVVDLEEQISKKGAAAQKKLIDDTSKQWMSVFADIPKVFDNAMQQMQTSAQSFGAFFRDVMRGLAVDAAGAEAKILETHLATWLAKKGITAEGVAEEVAMNAWAAITSIANYAAQAAAAAWAAISAIPLVGPFLAPAAAAAAFAGIIALAGQIKSAAGGYDIPAGINPVTQLHAQEMVLPAKYAEVIRGLAEGGGGGGGGTHYHFHGPIQAWDGQDVERVLYKYAPAVARASIKGGTSGVRLPTAPGRG